MSAGRQYRLLRELGTGTFGTVYQAEMTSAGGFKKQVALKVLHPVWEADKDAARRFRDEARLLGQLRHRHIVQVDGLVKVGGRWAVVMEFVPGCDANVVLKACRKAGEPFPVPAALEVVAAVAMALDAAYTTKPEDGGEPLRVIHRDIKPSNIRLTEDGDVKVLDFGIARADFQGREAVTHSVRYGSIRYMAPERHHNAPDTPAGDIFALGCVLFELLTGKPLGNVEAEWAQHHEKVHAKVTKLAEGLGEEGQGIVALITDVLAFEPDERPSAADVAERARNLARTFPGEDLASFAKRFIPQVLRFVPDTSMPIERTVSEGGSSSEDSPQPRSALPKILEEQHEEAAPAALPRRTLALAGAAIGAIVVTIILLSFKLVALAERDAVGDVHVPPRPPVHLAPGTPPATTTTMAATSPATTAGTTTAEPADAAGATSATPAGDAAAATVDGPDVDATAPAGATSSAPKDPATSSAATSAVPKDVGTSSPTTSSEASTTSATATATSPRTTTAKSSHGTSADDRDRHPAGTSSAGAATTSPVAPPVEPPTEPADTLRAVKFTLVQATDIKADCAGASASGTTSALVRDLLPGTCTVHATVGGVAYDTRVDVTQAAGLACDVAGGVLTCR